MFQGVVLKIVFEYLQGFGCYQFQPISLGMSSSGPFSKLNPIFVSW